jgi:hypothetical protein
MKIVTGTLLAALMMATPAAAATTWTNTPMPARVSWEAEGVAVFSAKNTYMVGGSSTGTGLIAHYNGTAWSQTLALLKPSVFHGVTTTPQGTAFAVGNYYDQSAGTERSLVEHYDGSVWRIMSTPTLAGADLVEFRDVAAVSDTNAWLVGWKHVGLDYTTVAEHWNGTKWTVTTTPNPGITIGVGNELDRVSVGSDGVAFAVGISGGTADLVLERTGTSWKRLALPTLPFDGGFYGVAAVNKSNVYLAGSYDDLTTDHSRPLVYHSNGTSFTRIAAANPAAWDESYMVDVTVTPTGKVYATGLAYQDTGGPIDQIGEVWQLASGKFSPMNPSAATNSAFSAIDSTMGAVYTVGNTTEVLHPNAVAMKLVG